MNIKLLNELSDHDLSVGSPKIKFERIKHVIHVKWLNKSKLLLNPKITSLHLQPLKLLHLDLFGPTRTRSLG